MMAITKGPVTLRNFYSNLQLETINQFALTEYNCGLLQNAIQQPPFCLFTDLLHLIAY